jgi:uncharacterized protein YprB with RNaseH-like and TPR domain
MGRPLDVYLDIETDRKRGVTVLGFYSSLTGLVQLVGNEITPRRVRGRLPKEGVLYTYNGEAFDLRVIEDCLGFDLRDRFDSRDLMRICRKLRFLGSQKKVERRCKFLRSVAPLAYWKVFDLWDEYCWSADRNVLKPLLTYNRHDLQGLRAIKRHVSERASARGWRG